MGAAACGSTTNPTSFPAGATERGRPAMIASSAAIPVVRPGDEAAAIAAFAGLASFETTHPSAADVEGLAARWPMGTAVYVSAVPSRPPAEQIDAAIRLRELGFTPVPHLAARNFATSDELDRWLARMSEEAQVHTVLVIGGDREAPAGLFHHAVEAIDSGLLQIHGITVDRHRGLSRRPCPHIPSGASARARRQDRGGGADRPRRPHRHPVRVHGGAHRRLDPAPARRRLRAAGEGRTCGPGVARLARALCPHLRRQELPPGSSPAMPAWSSTCSAPQRPTYSCARSPARHRPDVSAR